MLPLPRRAFPGALVACLLSGATALTAQQPEPPSDSVLAAITARGKLLLQYDIAEWHATDAILALHPDTSDMKTGVTRPDANGRWEMMFGHMSAGRDTLFIRYRAVQTGDSSYRAFEEPKPVPYTGAEREMANAFDTAAKALGPMTRPYNNYVVPSPLGGYWVYFVPAQNIPRIFPLGGDRRYHVAASGAIDSMVQLHRTVLDRMLPATGDTLRSVALVHTSPDSLPTETDVFVTLRRVPKISEIIATPHFIYEVHPDGAITWLRVPVKLGEPTTVAQKPVVNLAAARIDTVGSAPRIISPGNTRWRDTTTGWVLHREHLFALALGQTQPSLDQHPVWLDNGNLAVLQLRPTMVTVYTTDGRMLNTIGQSGYGPHDYHSRAAIAAWHDTVLVYDSDSARALLFRPDGAFLRSFDTGIYDNTTVDIDSRGRLRVEEQIHSDTLVTPHWTFFSLTGQRLDSIAIAPQQAPKILRVASNGRTAAIQIPASPEGSWALDTDGSVIYGNTARPELVMTDNGRDTVRIFGRSDLKVTAVDSARFATAIGPALRGVPGLDTLFKYADWPKTNPLWGDVAVDDKGYIWVTTLNPVTNGFYTSIYAQTGAYLGGLIGFSRQYTSYTWHGDRMAYPARDPSGRPVIIVYSINRRGM